MNCILTSVNMVCQKGKEKADLSGENCCILFVLAYLAICLFIMVKVVYWGGNWGMVFQKNTAEEAPLSLN